MLLSITCPLLISRQEDVLVVPSVNERTGTSTSFAIPV